MNIVEPIIGNNLKTNKKWNTQGSWNETIVLTNKNTQRLYASNATIKQNYGLQHLTRLEGFMCTQNHERREWKTIQNHSNIYYLLTLK
jgi:hypothetical protein